MDFIYESLYDSDKAIFNRLYNDYFYRRNNQFWYQEAMKKLPKLVNATRMLVCAEDLGMVPDCVAWVMNELKILSLEIQSMPKDPALRLVISVPIHTAASAPSPPTTWQRSASGGMRIGNGRSTISTVCCIKTDRLRIRCLVGRQEKIVGRHLASPSMLCVLGIQDWMSIDERLRLADANAERINVPANPKHYWRYRMHIGIEELMKRK